MTAPRTFERQVRPVRVHLTLDRGHYLCGYVQRAADPAPAYDQTPICGPCVLAFEVVEFEYRTLMTTTRPPDTDAATTVALLRETHWDARCAHLDLEKWIREQGPQWEAWRHGPSTSPG